MKNSKIYALAAVFLFIAIIAASAYYFASDDSGVTGNVISLKNIFKKQITDSRVRIPPESPIYSFNISGVFASARCGNISNLSIDIFTDINWDYKAKVKWQTSPRPASSFLYLTGYSLKRLNKNLVITDMQQGDGTGTNIEIELNSIEENKEYTFEMVTFWGGCPARYMLNITTPPIGVASRVQCKKIIENGPVSDKLNLLFVPYNYTAEDISTGKFEADVREVLYTADSASPWPANRRSLFGIPVFNKTISGFNIFIANKSVTGGYPNQLISFGKTWGINKTKDIVIVMENINEGTAYAQGIGTGLWIMLPKGSSWSGKGSLLAHEMAHLIGMDEEYYFLGGGTNSPRNAPNCDYGNLTCEKWCRGTRTDLTEMIHSAKRDYMRCFEIISSSNEEEWREFCPTLDFEYILAKHLYSISSAEEFCALPPSPSQISLCYAGTFIPLEDENIGIDCNPGYGCYFGCGTNYYYTRGDYVSIMGGGAMGGNNRIYRDMDAASPTPIMPDFSKVVNDELERYFSQFTTKYTLARSPISRVIPTRRISPP